MDRASRRSRSFRGLGSSVSCSSAAILPYSRTLRQQMSDGRLYEPAKDRAYDMKLRQLTGRVI